MNQERQSQEQLAAELQVAQKLVHVGARYEHYKKLTYTVLAVALREEDNVPCVIYQAEYGKKLIWIRPVVSWLEDVPVDGRTVKRFTKL